MDLSDGLFVLAKYREALAIFLVTISGLGSGLLRAAKVHGGKDLLAGILLVPALGSLALVGVALGLVLLGRLWPEILVAGSQGVVIFGVLLSAREAWLYRNVVRESFRSRAAWIFAGILGLFCILRLGFIAGLLLPPYVDSPTHYSIVRDFLSPPSAPEAFYSLSSITTHYYHFGFHAVTAWLSLASGLEVAQAIELLGQVLLIIAPLSIGFLAYSASENQAAGLAAGALAAFAWRMPFFAANWGKYPAIAGLALFPAVLGLWILYRREPNPLPESRYVTILATVALALVHTRLILCLILAGLSYGLSAFVNRRSSFRFGKASALALIPLFAFLLLWKPALRVFYTNGYYLSLAVLALLLPFAVLSFARYSLATTAFVFFLWLASQMRLPLAEGRASLLDQTFIQTTLYIPLALMGGFGFAGLLEKLNGRRVALWTAFGAQAAVLLLGFISSDNLSPDVCCNYVRPADLQAIDWIKHRAPQDSVVWIAGFKPRRYMLGTDAGIWVRALTGRNVNLLRYDFDWASASAFDHICRPYYQDVLIYQGGLPFSFDEAGLSSQAWLSEVFESGRANIYRASCDTAQ